MSAKNLAIAVFFFLSLSGSLASAKTQRDALEKDVRDLYSKNAMVRADSAKKLVSAGSTAVPLLKAVLCEKSKSNFDLAWRAAAKALGDLKAHTAVPCLVDMLMYEYPSIGPVEMKSDETLAHVDPAFAALVQIGEPGVPVIRQYLPFLDPGRALMAVRVLRLIGSPSAKEATDSYIKILEGQIHLVRVVMENSPPTKEPTAQQ
jgi:hypothetical protein